MYQWRKNMPDKGSIISFLKKGISELSSENIGSSAKGNVDKSGYCYHTITKAWGNDNIFSGDVAKYRHSLLCKLCADKGVTILFSVAMPTHTHEVFITPNWETLSETIRILNTNVCKYIKKEMIKKGRKNTVVTKLFCDCPIYAIVKDIRYLFFLGKYIYDNPLYLKEEGRIVPYSCFWMFEKGYFKEPYDKAIYKKLFGLEPFDLLTIYQTKTKDEVKATAKQLFIKWTEEDNKRLFINSERHHH